MLIAGQFERPPKPGPSKLRRRGPFLPSKVSMATEHYQYARLPAMACLYMRAANDALFAACNP